MNSIARLLLHLSLFCVFWLLGGFWSQQAAAKDKRLALLVGHTQGWKGDPRLRYAIRGDVLPMARILRKAGFRTKILRNPSPTYLRKVLRQIHRQARRTSKITTFLFYYSGHADRRYFHLGRRGKRPLSYKEFVRFLRRLPVRRRFALFDACFSGEIIRQFGSLARYRELVRKGATGMKPVDLSRTIPNQGEERGLQVMSSSLRYAWESKRYRASIFTHHVLKGLRGQADRDKDGKISMNELFNFVSDGMLKEVRQKPQLFGVIHRSRSYALAPAYHSRLQIGRNTIGRLQIQVANFVWKHHKQRRRRLHLAVVHGWGTVKLKRGRRCFQQKIFIPKGSVTKLSSQWKGIKCNAGSYVRKGGIVLPYQPVKPRVSAFVPRALEMSGGVWNSPLAGSTFLIGGRLGLRWRYFAAHLELAGTERAFANRFESLLWSAVHLEGGWEPRWGRFTLSFGANASIGLLLQDLSKQTGVGALFRYGLYVSPAFWLTETWGLSLQLEAGATFGMLGQRWEHLWGWRAMLGVRYRLL